MNTQTETRQALPDLVKELGLSLECSKAEPDTQNDSGKDWHNLCYTVKLSRHGKTVWAGDYRLGIGHVKIETAKRPANLSEDERCMFDGWKRTPHADFKDKVLQCYVAAKVANSNGIAPQLADVLHSLICDGSAYFDAQSFEDWARDLGYDADSRKAESIYRACDEIGRKLVRAFTPEELAQLREAANYY